MFITVKSAARYLALGMALGTLEVRATDTLKVAVHQVLEWEYQAKARYDNPFRDVSVYAMVTLAEGGQAQKIPSFWAGGSTWKFRFSSATPGTYTFVTHSSDRALKGQTGTITVPPTPAATRCTSTEPCVFMNRATTWSTPTVRPFSGWPTPGGTA